ncbi:hypothetical protein KSP40_PGU009755 [Platanthera guangdongensis]|uniref:CxC1-like cysteine cluster associated with KDZ transposases domain-containing protein n=1 Tax=Platanthera guangdongensis TaxID=2320717 RepID=A0ABR2LK23_9ASPA
MRAPMMHFSHDTSPQHNDISCTVTGAVVLLSHIVSSLKLLWNSYAYSLSLISLLCPQLNTAPFHHKASIHGFIRKLRSYHSLKRLTYLPSSSQDVATVSELAKLLAEQLFPACPHCPKSHGDRIPLQVHVTVDCIAQGVGLFAESQPPHVVVTSFLFETHHPNFIQFESSTQKYPKGH